MKTQFASFLLPLHADSAEQEKLNAFLRSRRIVQSRKELAVREGEPHWAILVEYLDDGGGAPRKEKATLAEILKDKVDYKKILSPEDFSLFSNLRDARKIMADEAGILVYAICTNEQMAEIARRRPKNRAELMKIAGIGENRAEKYGPGLLKCVQDAPPAAPAGKVAGTADGNTGAVPESLF